MLAMFARRLELPSRSFFLFGPRGTGKTTWLGLKIPDGEWFDLLRTQRLLDLMRTPDLFRQRIESLKEGSWVVVDEIQRMPELLNEIHSLMVTTQVAGRPDSAGVSSVPTARPSNRCGACATSVAGRCGVCARARREPASAQGAGGSVLSSPAGGLTPVV
jgi:hypothetical protein